MRKNNLIGILVVVLFLLPMINLSSDYSPAAALSNPTLPQTTDNGLLADSGDHSSGVGAALPVTISGQVSNAGQGTLSFDSSSSGIGSVTLDDGWTGTDLQAQIDSLSWTAEDVLQNGDLNDYHNELYVVTPVTTDNDDNVRTPDGWTIVKDVVDYSSPHPQHGMYELDSDSNGNGGTWGVYVVAELTTGYDADPNDAMYISQMVSMPYRELYSATVTFDYRVSSSSDMDDITHLFIRLAGHEEKFQVFQSGDTTDTWLSASAIIPAASMTGLSDKVMRFDIGIATDENGFLVVASDSFAYIDNVQVDLDVRPFPEQIDLKANGALVWGSTTHSIYPYVPDDDNRDCYDDSGSGIDLDGYANDGVLDTGIYSSGYLTGTMFETGMQFPLDIPKGAIITSAYLEVEAASSSSPYLLGMRVHVADEDNVLSFNTIGPIHLEDRFNWVETSIDWYLNSWITSPDTRYRSPELGPLVQNVVSRSGWSEGNYICIMTSMMYADYYQRWNGLKGTYGYDGEDRARLFVEYVIPEPEDTVIFFDYQKDITVDHLDVAADLTNFPVLIDITDTDLRDHVLSNGNDIAFTVAGNPVAHEIELYEETTGHLIAWVKIPSLSSSINTSITMHYGCLNAPPPLSSRVWDDFETVQHLNQDPSGINYDSTSNNHDGTSYGGLSSSDLVAGQIGNAISFDGTDDVISIGQIDTDEWSQFTMSAWIYRTIDKDARIFSKSITTTPENHIITLRLDPTNAVTTRIQTDGTGGFGASYNGNQTVANYTWNYISWSWSAARGSVIAYLNGNPVIEVAHGGTTIIDSDAMFVIGNNDLFNDRYWAGMIDEARLSTSVRSEDWIDTEYNNQVNPSGFYSVGSETKTTDTWTDASEPSVHFTTSSPTSVSMDVIITMDVGGEAQTMDTDFNEGVSYFIETGASVVNWTAKVMVSPPAGATSFGFTVEYPRAEWKATKVLNPLNQPKTLDADWWYHGGTLTLNASSIDFWGVWTLKFISWNFIEDVQLNNAVFDITDLAQFTVTTPTVLGARVGLDLVDPDGNTWYSVSEQTGTDPSHRFPSFKYRKNITIPSAQIYGSVNNFPVLIQFTDTDLHDTNRVRTDASDILFAVGDSILDHEIEFFDQDYSISEAFLTAWVKTNLTNGVDNTITMYYGAEIVDNLENPAGVWSNEYEAVWHLGETTASGSTHYDSSGNGYDGTRNGNSEVFSGAGYSQTFDGISDYISIDPTLTPQNDVLITGWFRLPSPHTDSSASTKVIMEKYIDIDQDMVIALVGQDYGQGTVPNGSLVFKVESTPNSAMYKWTQLTTWAANQWYFIACYADEDDPSNNQIWINMNWNTDAGQVGSTTFANMSYVEEWRLGGGDYDSGIEGSGYFNGRLDEFTVSNNLRTDGWLRNHRNNYINTGSFLVPGTDQERTSPNHTFPKTIDSTAPAGEWTAVVHYNDTGTTVTNKAGLFETTFVVRHPSTLTLTAPSDAVGNRLSVKTAGDSIIVEYELTDDITALGVPGATVTMNWTSPSTITLDDYGAGFYGKVLDTTALGDNKQWRVEVQSSHSYYNDATEYFNVDLYHATTLSAAGGSTTPADFIFNTTLTFEDDFTGAPITGATIVQSGGLPVSFTFADNNDGTYNLSIPTSSLTLGLKQYTFNATVSGAYLHAAQVNVEFTLRAHYTAVSVSGDLTTPHGENTQVTIYLLDLDTGDKVSIADVGTMTFSYFPSYPDDTVGLYVGWITSDDWVVGTVTATLTITLSEPRIRAPLPYEFEIEILAHATTVTVTGATTTPYGNQTDLTVILDDLEPLWDPVPIGSVSNIELQHPFGSDNFGSYGITLDTSSWPVGTHTVTVIITILGGEPYNAPSNYQFDITIRSMTSVMYTGPSALNFTLGSDFTVNLHLNVSEAGQYYGDPITDRNTVEFSVPGYTPIIDTSQQAIGLYKLTIDWGQLSPGGSYQITVYFDSEDSKYADTLLVIQFSYRPIVSYLSSPNYPQVTTPYQRDVEITLEYADADSLTGIDGATITSPDHPTWIANWTDETGGVYSVWIDVSTLAKGTHNITLRAYKAGYDAKTLTFKIVIRDAYTSATPLVGSLDIPIGNSVEFDVDYSDLDRSLPVDNLTSPYTQVISTWGNFSVEYIPLDEVYRITFYTSDSDTIAQNQVYSFTFSKENYQTVQFSITVTIRTHNTDFRIVSSIEPTSTTGTFNISVYYGDLDNALGVRSALVVFSVENASGIVSSSYDYDVGDGFYIIQVPASQFGLGLQTLTVYADWTGAVLKYQDKFFVTSANVVGKESALTLLIGSEPTAYNEDMSYTFLYSELFSGDGIDNDTNDVFIYVNFQGESVDLGLVTITEIDPVLEKGKYAIAFNSGIFSRTGLIYMNVFVNWSKGVAPFYANRTDVISVRVLPRDTLLSITPPSSTNYDENATLTLTFEDITGGSSSLITGLTKQEISLNISFSYVEAAGVYTISFDTDQFGSLGLKAILIDVTWVGTPFYANRTGRVTYINVIVRETNLEYLTPPPTQYGDQAVFNVTWTDVTAGSSDPIIGATLILKEGVVEINPAEYVVVEIASGIYQVTLSTTFAANPGTITLRVEMTPTELYYSPSAINRQFLIQDRDTQVAAEPVPDVPFGSSITITLSYLDLFTGTPIANDSLHSYPVTIEIMSPSGQTFTSTWSALYQTYSVVVDWDSTKNATWIPGAQITFTIRMSYDYIAPFYTEDNAVVSFRIRIRDSSLALDTEPETTPYLDDIVFTVFYSDDDAGEAGIAGADISIVGLTESEDYLISEGSPGYYTITVFTTSLGSLGTHALDIQATKPGAPYHDDAVRTVSVLVKTRATNLEVTVPPSQTLYLDDLNFEFEFNDLDAGTSIVLSDLSIIHLYWPNMTEINQLDYSIIENSGTYELTISSTVLSTLPVTGLSIRVIVDWLAAQAPFYADDFTIVKITITGRSILVETEQIERTPKGDILNISINLSDLDTGIPIEGAIIQFSCQGHILLEGFDYTRTEGLGTYTFNINTLSLAGTGTFLFDIEVQWNPNLLPFYSNRSVVSLTGLVDLVRTSLQVNALVPSSVQFTGTVSLNITWKDLDHNLPITGYDATIDSNVKYLVSGLRPASLVVYEYGSSGIYNITFSTSDLSTLGPYTLRIVAAVSVYASVTVTPQFNVIAIYTDLTPVEASVSAYWKSSTEISVDYVDLLNGVPISSAFSVIWEYKVSGITIDSGSLTEIGSPGRYAATIDTSSFGAGNYFIEVTAIKDRYTEAITTISLGVLTIPSEIRIQEPGDPRIEVNRGDPVYIEVELWDINYGLSIYDTQVQNVSGKLQVYASLESVNYYMSYDVFSGLWNVTIPGYATILTALLDYNIRIFASFNNYDSAAESIGMYIIQTATQLRVTGIPDPTKLEVYYLQNVTLQLNFSANALDMLVNDGNVSWIDDIRDIYLNFTSIGNGMWTLTFNTSILGFGTVGVSFYGYPTNTTLAQTITSMTLTIKNVPTDVDGPTETIDLYWGWTGNISLDYIDTYNTRFVSGAIVTYSYGNQDFNATDLGNGTYTLYIDTTLLDSNIRERISTLFFIPNYETQSRSFFIRVLERPTELIIEYPDQNFVTIDQGIIYLASPMGDSIDISLFYNDTSPIGGLFGGITSATFSEITDLRAPAYIGSGEFMPIVFQQGFGYYNFTFDTNDGSLYAAQDGPIILPSRYFEYVIQIFDANRQMQTITIRIEIVYTPTSIEHNGQIVDPDDNILYTLINGENIVFDIYLNDTWHVWGIDDASFYITTGATAIISSNSSLGNGHYRLVIQAVGYGGQSVIHIIMSREFHDDAEINFEITTMPNEIDILLANVAVYGLPISFFIIVLLGAYVRVWSVPKRIRQINGQLKALRKGKVPKPIKDVKSRQQLAAELFNDTFVEMKITRTAAQMPEDPIPIEVPEMGELLTQLSILTHLSAEELDEFQADIAKMKMSEQAAFVKEVIMQEAIRAARRDGRTVEETLTVVEQEALRRLGGEEAVEPIEVVGVEPEERVFLEEEKKAKVTPKDEVKPAVDDKIEEVPEEPSDKMSLFEIEELRKELERKGVPPHEIETIIEQAKELPRDLIDELVKSLEGKKD